MTIVCDFKSLPLNIAISSIFFGVADAPERSNYPLVEARTWIVFWYGTNSLYHAAELVLGTESTMTDTRGSCGVLVH